MKASSLQLKNFEYPVISMRATPSIDDSVVSKTLPVEMSANVYFHDSGSHFALLSMAQKSSEFAYTFEIEAFTMFSLDVDACKELYVKGYDPGLISVNVARLLYSASREMLAVITSRAPYGTACLPSVVIEKKDVHVQFEKSKRDKILKNQFSFSKDQLSELNKKLAEAKKKPTRSVGAPKKVTVKKRVVT